MHEADLCFKLPENVSTMKDALSEPLGLGFHVANQLDAHVGQTVDCFWFKMKRTLFIIVFDFTWCCPHYFC